MADEIRSRAFPARCPCRVARNELTMRVLLRNKQTRRYCAGPNEWAAVIAQALIFSSVQHAAKFAFNEKVQEAEIVVRCDLVEQEVALPLLPEWCELHDPGSVPRTSEPAPPAPPRSLSPA